MRIAKNFTLKELTKSHTALRLGLKNEPTKDGVQKLTVLANSILQPIRDRLGPIRITSAYRSTELNQAIGGSSNSQHCRYEAVDCQYVENNSMDNLMIYQTLIDLDLDFDQIILEFGDADENNDATHPDWIHISYKMSDNRKEVLVAYKNKNNKTKYRKPREYEIL